MDGGTALLIGLVSPTLVLLVQFLLNRRRDKENDDVNNESTAVKTVNSIVDILTAELARERIAATEARRLEEVAREDAAAAREKAREDAAHMLEQMRELSQELDGVVSMLREHRRWDAQQIASGAAEPPPLPDLTGWRLTGGRFRVVGNTRTSPQKNP